MAEEAEFGQNPFRDLDISRFRKAEEELPQPRLSPEDRDLFLRSWERVPEEKTRRTGFLMSDLCCLPAVKRGKNRKQTSVPARPVTNLMKDRNSVKDISETGEFLLAMRNTVPLAGKGRDIAPKPVLRPAHALQESTLEDFMAGRLEFAVSFSNEYLEGHVVGLDELIMNRLREGQFSAEANLDLHGLNASQAFEALRVFIRNAWLKDLRSVLVVTGRGRNSPDGQAVLRQKLQTWLTKEPFKRVVLAFCTARPHDGGPGSIYLLLRRFRKKGRIFWERMFIEDSDI